MRKALVGGLVAVVAMSGCGGDDEKSADQGDQAAQTTATQETAPSAGSTADIPTYEEAAEIALKNPATQRACSSGKREDNDIGSYPEGEIYKRMLCNGAEQMDYVVGKQAVSENLEPARELHTSPIWTLPGQAYIKGPGSDDDFAQQVKDACGCGEVVPETG